MSPDWSAKEEPVPYAKTDDPQSLNLYSYVRNNPLSRTDPDGHCPFCIPALAVVGGGAEVGGEVGALGGPPGVVVGVVVGAVIGGGILAYEHFHEDAPASGTEQGRDAQGKFLPTTPGQTQPGAGAEKAGLEAAGATKNNETINGTKRDGTGTGTAPGVEAGQHVEVKSGKTIAGTKQLNGMAKTARAETGKPLVVVTTHPDATLTKPVQNNPDIVHKPLNQ
jgi:hypothetical protein